MSLTCSSPMTLFNQTLQDFVTFDCRKCMNCLQKKQIEIVFRLEETLKHTKSSKNFRPCFATFTYGPEYLPIAESGYPTLKRSDFTKMLRRYDMLCRRKYGVGMYPKLKFLASGEYGTLGARPHYHMICVNADHDLLLKAWSIYGKPLGVVEIQTTFKTNAIGYTAKYISKHENNQLTYKHVEPEFVSWSRGLGKEFLTPQMMAYFHADPENRNTITLKGGVKMHLPIYYKNKIGFSEDEKWLQQRKGKEYREKADMEALKNFEHVSDDVREQTRALHMSKLEHNQNKIRKQQQAIQMKLHQKFKNL
jgi:hypothetical protein